MIAILGAGAMGGLWAAHLHNSAAVCFIDPRIANTTRHTLLFVPFGTDPKASQAITLEFAYTPPQAAANVDILLVCTKSHHTLAALRACLSHFEHAPAIVLFQNGLGSQQAVLTAFPEASIYAAITTEGAFRKGNKVVHAGLGTTTIGPVSQPAITMGNALIQQLFQACALEVNQSSDIWPRLWRKLAINCAINPFTAICNCLNGEVPEQALFQQLWPQLLAELHQLLGIGGVSVSQQKLEAQIMEVIDRTAANRSSMLQDIEAGRKTEIDHINGFAAKTLMQEGLKYEANQQLWERVRALGH